MPCQWWHPTIKLTLWSWVGDHYKLRECINTGVASLGVDLLTPIFTPMYHDAEQWSDHSKQTRLAFFFDKKKKGILIRRCKVDLWKLATPFYNNGYMHSYFVSTQYTHILVVLELSFYRKLRETIKMLMHVLQDYVFL